MDDLFSLSKQYVSMRERTNKWGMLVNAIRNIRRFLVKASNIFSDGYDKLKKQTSSCKHGIGFS